MLNRKLNNYDLFIFDCDGVILKSNYIKLNCFLQCIKKDKIIYRKNFEKYLVKNIGVDRRKKFKFYIESIKNEKLSKSNLEEYLDKYSYYSKKLVKQSALMPGIKKFLIELKKANKKVILLTNADQNETIKIIKYKKLKKFFFNIFGRPKSKIVNLNNFFKKNSFKKIIFFGDGLNDYKVSKKFNFDFIYVKEDSFDRNSFKKLKIYNEIENFLNIIK